MLIIKALTQADVEAIAIAKTSFLCLIENRNAQKPIDKIVITTDTKKNTSKNNSIEVFAIRHLLKFSNNRYFYRLCIVAYSGFDVK